MSDQAKTVQFDELTLKTLEPITISEKIKPEVYKKETPGKQQESAILIAERATVPITKEEKTEEDPKTSAEDIGKKTDTEILLAEEADIIFKQFPDFEYTEIKRLSDDGSLIKLPDKTPAYAASAIVESEEAYDASPANRWSFGIKAAPQFAYRFNSSDPEALDRGKTVFEQNESYLLTYNLGLNVSYQLSDKFSIESGLQYIRMGQSIRNIGVYYHPENKSPFNVSINDRHPQSVLTSMGAINFSDPTLYFDDIRSDRVTIIEGTSEPEDDLASKGDRLNQHLGFLEIPLHARYNLYNRRSQIQLTGGVGFNYLVSNNVVLEKDGIKESIGETALIRKWNLSVSAGTAFIIPLSNNINFHIEPVANLFVTSMTSGREYNVHPFGLSLYTGLKMSL